jgi:hypothetical protein
MNIVNSSYLYVIPPVVPPLQRLLYAEDAWGGSKGVCFSPPVGPEDTTLSIGHSTSTAPPPRVLPQGGETERLGSPTQRDKHRRLHGCLFL